jgi:hypothetical protein
VFWPPRIDAPAQNQRPIVVRSVGNSPTRDERIAALGRRAQHYRILSVVPEADTEEADSSRKDSNQVRKPPRIRNHLAAGARALDPEIRDPPIDSHPTNRWRSEMARSQSVESQWLAELLNY